MYAYPFYNPLDFVQDYPGEPVPEPIWILLKQETVSGSRISWNIFKSATHPRQITTKASPVSFLQAGCPSSAQPMAAKHLRQWIDVCVAGRTV